MTTGDEIRAAGNSPANAAQDDDLVIVECLLLMRPLWDGTGSAIVLNGSSGSFASIRIPSEEFARFMAGAVANCSFAITPRLVPGGRLAATTEGRSDD